jgi:putative PIN family toxin of toxin-antitoxin system
MNPKRVVIDTNVYISALLNPQGTPRKAINLVVRKFQLLQSSASYVELETRINKKKFDKYLKEADRLDFLSSVKKQSLFIEVQYQRRFVPIPMITSF